MVSPAGRPAAGAGRRPRRRVGAGGGGVLVWGRRRPPPASGLSRGPPGRLRPRRHAEPSESPQLPSGRRPGPWAAGPERDPGRGRRRRPEALGCGLRLCRRLPLLRGPAGSCGERSPRRLPKLPSGSPHLPGQDGPGSAELASTAAAQLLRLRMTSLSTRGGCSGELSCKGLTFVLMSKKISCQEFRI